MRGILVLPALVAGFALGFAQPSAAQPISAELEEFRTLDGSANNRRHPRWGAAGSELLRLAAPDYADGLAAPAGAGRPGAREVSNACAAQTDSVPNAARRTHILWAWGQFLDHDISLTGAADPEERFDIPVPAGDLYFDPAATGTALIPFRRSLHGGGAPRQQLNQITAWIDASQVYGSDGERARALRRRGGRGDRLKTGPGGLLPLNRRGLDNQPSASPAFFLAGDVRANENVALTAFHALFVREHNRIVKLLRRQGGTTPEERYELARALVGAEMQAITYNEFLPALLGPGALAPYAGYRPRVHPGIANLFSTAVYRFGHSMLPERLARLGADGRPVAGGPLPLRDAFFAPHELVASGLEPILRGLAARQAEEVDVHVVDAVRNFLFGRPGEGGFDLAALNLQRGRDHGLPSYNRVRAELGLAPAASFLELTGDAEAARRLAAVYASVDDVDAWLGALAEPHVPGAMVGELAVHVLRDQFERLRDGDRFFYRRALPPELVAWVEAHTLARIVRLNTRIGDELADDVFSMP